MSYSCTRALGRPRDERTRLEDIENPGEKTYHEIHEEYIDTEVELHESSSDTYYILRLEELDMAAKDWDKELDEYFDELGDDSLEHAEPGRLSFGRYRALAVDAADTEFHVEPAMSGSHPSIRWPEKAHPDLLVSHDDWEYEDYKDLQEQVLFFVNGYAHPSSYSEHGVYVLKGNQSSYIGEFSELNLLDFGALGPKTELELSSDMLYRPHEDDRYYNRAYLDLDTSLEGKTLLLSIGGYLHVLDDLYKVVGERNVMINFNRYPIVRRYFESLRQIDLSDIEYTPINNNEWQRYTHELIESERFIEQLLDLPQSFAIILDTSPVYVERHPLQSAHLDGVFYSYRKPVSLLQIQRGRMRAYRCTQEEDTYVLNIAGDLLERYHFDDTHLDDLETVAPWRRPHQPWYRDRAQLVEIGREVIEHR